MDWTLYWFMFPVSIFVSLSAMVTGIGGSALYMPIYVIIFPLLGPEYPFETTAVAALVALITMVFSFCSGTSLYAYRRMINYKFASSFLWIAIPIAIIAAWLAPVFPEWVLILFYAILVAYVAYSMLSIPVQSTQVRPKPNVFLTGFGAFTTGTSAVGIGEVIMPQLISNGVDKKHLVGTSVFIVFCTVLAASSVLAWRLSKTANIQIPWNVIIYIVPGVLIGSQIGPRIQSRFSRERLKRVIIILFVLISISMLFVAYRKAGF